LQQHDWPEDNGSRKMFQTNKGDWITAIDDDRSLPRPVRFTWAPYEGEPAGVTYELTVSAQLPRRSGRAEEKVRRVGLTEPWAEIENLRIGAAYAWKVRAHRGRRVVGESVEGHFRTHPAPPRWLRIPGTTNVRDLGGWPLEDGRRIRQGMIYRGSELNSHCQLSEDGVRVLMEDLKIRTDIDLRGVDEECCPVLDPARVRYVNLPVMSYDSIANHDNSRYYRDLFNLLSYEDVYPVYLHCWGGADRTGTAAFLLGALLGMSPEDLSVEYELTTLSIWGERLRSSDMYQDMLQTLALFSLNGKTYQQQVERYLQVIGVSAETIARIRHILIEE
jgi:protein tyrosine/serine phosphatase